MKLEASSTYNQILKIATLAENAYLKQNEAYDETNVINFVESFLVQLRSSKQINAYETIIVNEYKSAIKREVLHRINRTRRAK